MLSIDPILRGSATIRDTASGGRRRHRQAPRRRRKSRVAGCDRGFEGVCPTGEINRTGNQNLCRSENWNEVASLLPNAVTPPR